MVVWVSPKSGCNWRGKSLWFRVIWECDRATSHFHTTTKLEFYRLFRKLSKWFRWFLIFTQCYWLHWEFHAFLLLLVTQSFVHFLFGLIVHFPDSTIFFRAFDQLFRSLMYFNSVRFGFVLLKWPKKMGTRLRQQTSFIKWFWKYWLPLIWITFKNRDYYKVQKIVLL